MAVAARRMTLEEFHALPEDGNRSELIDGELFVTAAPSPDHQDVLSAIVQLLLPATEGERLGKRWFAPVEVRLPAGSIVQPDLVYVRRERLHIREPDAIVGVPDLVVDVLSPSTRSTGLGKKRQVYEAAGIPEYWVAEAAPPDLRIFVLEDGRYEEVEARGDLLASRIVPGLLLDLIALREAATWASG